MSNQRKEGKKLVASWVWEQDLERIKEIAGESGVSVSDIMKQMISDLGDMNEKARAKIITRTKKGMD
tara:strand:- start:245 stop:445 length:201 start_codon:yes stop_codon:yes gene_type:complete